MILYVIKTSYSYYHEEIFKSKRVYAQCIYLSKLFIIFIDQTLRFKKSKNVRYLNTWNAIVNRWQVHTYNFTYKRIHIIWIQRLNNTSILIKNKRTYFYVANTDNLSANYVILTERRSWYSTFIRVRLNLSLIFNLVYVFSENNILWTYTRYKITSIEQRCHFCKSVLPHTISVVYSFRTIRQERQETNYK